MSEFRDVMLKKLLESRAVALNGCWLWTGAISTHGYGVTNYDRQQIRAHQAGYRVWRGEVPAGLQLDHECRNRACFNPKHLECVTSRENTLRGDGITARAAQATHCPQGHAYDSENTYTTPKGHRDCRVCRNAAGRRRNGKAIGSVA
jgi:HNH endonuclease